MGSLQDAVREAANSLSGVALDLAGKLGEIQDQWLLPTTPQLATDMVMPPDLQAIVDGNFEHHTFVVAAGDTQTFSNQVVSITEDWQVFGTVNFVNAEVVFTGNFLIIVEGSGSLTMSGTSSMHDQDESRFTGGTIRATGNLDIQGTAANKIPIKSTSLISLPRGANDFATSVVRHVDFRDARVALSSGNSAGVYEFNRFLNNDRGVVVLARAGVAGAGNPTVQDNHFVGNSLGVAVAGPANPNFPEEAGKGLIQHNEFRTNTWGVRCSGAPHAGDGTGPEISANNFRNHYAEAYGGTTGVTVNIAGETVSLIADSDCDVDGNFFAAGETTWTGGGDTISNNAGAAIANNAPAIAAADQPEVITNQQNLNNKILTRPLIVDDGGDVTFTGTLDANGFLWGSGTGGQIASSGLQVIDNGQLIIRTSDDNMDGLVIDGPSKRLTLFGLTGITSMHALLYRNSAALDDWTITNYDHAISLTAGLSRDAEVFTPSLTNFNMDNGNVAVFGASLTITQEDTSALNLRGEFHRAQLGTSTLNDNVASINAVGWPDLRVHVLGVINTLNLDGNTFSGGALGAANVLGNIASTNNEYLGIANALQDALATLTSTDDVIDGGLVGVLTQQNTNTITGGMIAQQNFGVLSILDVSYSITGSTFAYNAFGVANAITANVAVQTSNFRDNYLHALIGLPIALEEDILAATGITCTNCFFFRDDDASWDDGGGTITVTESLAANNAPNPPWLNNVVIAGPGETKSIGGALAAPAIAREGGRLSIEGQTVLGSDRFVFGAKTGGNAGDPTGHLTLRHSVVRDVPFIALTSSDSSIGNNVFQSSLEQIEVTGTGTNVECNQFNSVSLPVNWMRQADGGNELTFNRNLLTGSGGIDVGFADTDTQDTTVEDNGMTTGFAADGLVDRFQPGQVEFHRNNLITPRGFREINLGFLNDNLANQANVENNWWNSATGPTAPDNPGGVGAGITMAGGAIHPPPIPDWDPFATSAFTTTPLCGSFLLSPTSPTEIQDVTFTDNTFDPDGVNGIAQRTWNYGDGSPAESTAAQTIVHDFLDGGTTVSVTSESADGQTVTTSRTISVAHVPPVADFAAAIVDETIPVAYTDLSTHPNPGDAPPTGWIYAWDFDNNGVTDSALQNPSFKYADGGTKTVKLTVTDNDGQTDSETKTINVPHVAPVADFTFAPLSPTETVNVQLTDTSVHPNAPTDAVNSWSWSCSDGFTSTLQNPAHKFPDGATFTCTLTAKDNDNQQSSVTKSIPVSHVAPVANFAFTPATPTELQAVQSSDTSTHPNPNDAPPTGWTYAWNFNGEGTSSQRNPSFDYADGGAKSVTLTVTDNDGQTSTITRTVPVSHVAPVAGFTFDPTAPDPGDTVTFTSTATHPNAPTDGITSSCFDFGDGSPTECGNSVAHLFAVEGTFTVVQTVEDNDGLTATTSLPVAVGNFPPTVDFTFSPATPTDIETVSFDGTADDVDGTVESCTYHFGDGSPTTDGEDATHVFADDGVFTVVFSCTDDRGGIGTIAKPITVLNVGPTPGFAATPQPAFEGETVTFTNTGSDSDGTLSAFLYDFGDGATSTDASPTHVYAAAGKYVVSQTVTDDDGASATTTKQIVYCTKLADLPGGAVGYILGPGVSLVTCVRLGA